ncbi:MAG: hypothetical protein JRH18_07975 [Deltaproteobacteria bacterium]|nr:hypothetical protein [Deltaproteobacteria bacterium]MBW2151589.1 hypothetical protein [Deltaproteobacteria bacterium]
MIVAEVYGFETAKRNLAWRNELTLWLDTVKKSPGSFMVRTNLSIALHAAGRSNEALKQAHEAIALNPHHDTPHFVLGVIMYETGLVEQSRYALEKTLQINPGHSDAIHLLGKIKICQERKRISAEISILSLADKKRIISIKK